jgi:sulfite exporter TauE/SafE
MFASFAVFMLAVGFYQSNMRALIVGIVIFAFSLWQIQASQKKLKKLEELHKNLGERLFKKLQQMNKDKE